MPLDHYVSQVHLRNFYSPVLSNRMHAIRKSDSKQFSPDSESVCRLEGGNTNAYLVEDRAVEDFLKTIEPKYNSAIQKLFDESIDWEAIYVVAGFAAYVMTCSPTGMRIQSGPLRKLLELEMRNAGAEGLLPEPPDAFGGKSIVELLQSAQLAIDVDPKYPQAIGIAHLLRMVTAYGKSTWEVLVNPFADTPFFTSDFPVAIEHTADLRVVNRIVPLAPHLAVRIMPDVKLDTNQIDLNFSGFHYRHRKIGRAEVHAINRLVVQCAEDLVFYRDSLPWVRRFVTKNRLFRVDAVTIRVPQSNGSLFVSSQKIVPIVARDGG